MYIICGCTSEPDFSPVWTKIYIGVATATALRPSLDAQLCDHIKSNLQKQIT